MLGLLVWQAAAQTSAPTASSFGSAKIDDAVTPEPVRVESTSPPTVNPTPSPTAPPTASQLVQKETASPTLASVKLIETAAPTPAPTMHPTLSIDPAEYLYIVYYEGASCTGSTVASVHGLVSGEPISFVGRSSGSSCRQESVCLSHPDSQHCQNLPMSKTATVIYTVDVRSGDLYQCNHDSSACAIIDPDNCYQSSVFPSCYFHVVQAKDIDSSPELLQSRRAASDYQETYQIFFSDSNCRSFAGLYSFWTGDQDSIQVPSVENSIPCRAAMACLLNPQSRACTDLGGPIGFEEILSEIRNDVAYKSCSDSGFGGTLCLEPVGDECYESQLIPRCFYRWTTAKSLFQDPQKHLIGATASPTESPTSAPTRLPTESPTVAPSVYTEEEFLYVIYYGDEDCESDPVLVQGLVQHERSEFTGRSSFCMEEAICAIHDDPYCQNLPETATGSAFFSYMPGNTSSIQQCNTAARDDLCADAGQQCSTSAVVPHCRFHFVTTSELLNDPGLLKSSKIADTDTTTGAVQGQKWTLADQTYYLYYTDESCNYFAGLQGVVANATSNEWPRVGGDFECQDALVCVMKPDSERCQQIGGPTLGEINLYDTPCKPSSVLSSCYVRSVSGEELFRDPSEYLLPLTTAPTDAPTLMKANSGGRTPTTTLILLVAALAASVSVTT